MHVSDLMSGLAGILVQSDRLAAGKRYTFTYETNKILNLADEAQVRDMLQYFLGPNYGDVVSVTRPLFSSRYVIVVQPKYEYPLSAWLNAFSYAWQNMPGFEGTTWLQTEGGIYSTSPGGVPGVFRAGAETVSLVTSGGKETLMWAAIALVGLAILIPGLQAGFTRAMSGR